MPLALVLALAAGACSRSEAPPGVAGAARGFIGGVASDEPRATLVGREVLAARGNAADAAVAMYFALAATLPSRAGLGAGGTCLVFDPVADRTETIDFSARMTAEPSPAAVPSGARGIFALHSRHGRLRWAQLLTAGEELARFGVPVSRALAADLAVAAPMLARDAEARRIFLRPDGAPLAEGEGLIQTELAAVIGLIRSRGPGDFHVGPFAQRFVEGARRAGVPISSADLAEAVPAARPTLVVRGDGVGYHFAPPPALAGLTEAQLMGALAPRWRRTPPQERAHLFAEASLRVAADRAQWLNADLSGISTLAALTSENHLEAVMAGYSPQGRLPAAAYPARPDPAADADAQASFVAADRDGKAVACAVGMGDLFGIGRVASGTGVLIGGPTTRRGGLSASLGPMMAVTRGTTGFFGTATAGQLVFAGAASGGAPAAGSLVTVALGTLVDRAPLQAAMRVSRVHLDPASDAVLVEGGAGDAAALAARGYVVGPGPAAGRVNAVSCPGGLKDQPDTCVFESDERGAGLALTGN